MALIRCPECRQRISELAVTCPSCGRPNTTDASPAFPEPSSDGLFKKIAVYVLLAFAAMVIVAMVFQSGQESDPSPPNSMTFASRFHQAKGDLKGFVPQTFTESQGMIMLAVAAFGAWASLIEEAQVRNDDSVLVEDVNTFASSLRQTQRQSFPKLRTAYGGFLKQSLWENDIDVHTSGRTARIITFVGAAFAANKNIQTFHNGASPMLSTLRFSRVQYKWFRGASKYTYYDLDSPADDRLIGVTGTPIRE